MWSRLRNITESISVLACRDGYVTTPPRPTASLTQPCRSSRSRISQPYNVNQHSRDWRWTVLYKLGFSSNLLKIKFVVSITLVELLSLKATLPRTALPELKFFKYIFLCLILYCTLSFDPYILFFLSDFRCFVLS